MEVRRGRWAWIGVLLLPVTGCAVGPDYERPELDVAPDEWHARIEAEMAQPEPDISRWWESLGDTTLTALIQQAELGNLDLRTAVARVREARAAVIGDVPRHELDDGVRRHEGAVEASLVAELEELRDAPIVGLSGLGIDARSSDLCSRAA